MKQKLLTLLTLLLCVCGGAWADDLSTHTPGKYEATDGYNTTLATYDSNKYEVYYMNWKSSKGYVAAGKSYVTDNTAYCLISDVANLNPADFSDGWGTITGVSSMSGSNTSPAAEWAVASSSSSTHYIGLTSSSSLTIKVSGYDQFSFAGRDAHASTEGKQFVVKIDGVEQSFDHSATEWTVYRFDISTGEHTIVVTGNGTDANRLRGFSLRVPAADTHSVTVNYNGEGDYGTASAAATSVAEGSTTVITASPAAGYKVTNWAVSGTGATISPDGASNSLTTTLTMGTADATVTCTFAAAAQYAVTHTLSHVTATSGATGANAAMEATEYTAVFSAETGYDLPDGITVAIGGETKTVDTDYTWNQSTGTVTIPAEKVTGAIVITVTGIEHVAPLSGTIFSLTMGNVSTKKSLAANEQVDLADYATITGGTATFTNTGSEKGAIDKANPGIINFDGNAAYLILTFNDPLKTGDRITITNKTSVEMAFTTTASLDATYQTTTSSGTGTFTVPAALDDVSTLYCWRATTSGLKVTAINVTRYKVSYNANGGSGSMEPNSNVVAENGFTAPGSETFTGWNTSADGSGTAYNAGDVVTADVTLYAQWGSSSAPSSVTVTPAASAVYVGKSVTLTAIVAGGVPTPTVTWYQCDNEEKANPDKKGTGATYEPSTAAVGTFYFYAVASNGISPDATSDVVTLTVKDPNTHVDGYNYYVAAGDPATNGSKIYAKNITAELVAGGNLDEGAAEGSLTSLNSNYVAYITSSETASNDWGPKFTASVNGKLSVGVKIGSGKTLSVSNVSDFNRQEVGEAAPTANGSASFTPASTYYGVIIIDVEADTDYKFSVAGSKMGFYGFEFTPETVAITPSKSKVTYSSAKALDFTDSELKAYIISGLTKTSATMEQVTEVPANTGLILVGTAGTPYDIPVGTATTPLENKLYASVTATPVGASTTLVLSDGTFKTFTGTEIPANKAYLMKSELPAEATELILDFDGNSDITTGIENVEAAQKNFLDGEFYNLNGQRVAQPTKGLYIVNGRKIIVK